MAKVSLSATVPVMAYGNLQPTIEAEADTVEEAVETALGHIQAIWNRVGEKPLDINRGVPVGELLRCRVSGTEVIFDPVAHTYHDRNGNRYLGGSTFAGRYKAEFPANIISDKMAQKYGVSAQEILDMWALNAEASATFGTSVHAALQLYGEYLELSKSIKDGSDESALTSNPVLRPIVEAFFDDVHRAETAHYEEFVADAKTLRCGLIDRLVVEKDGLYVEDFKTNATMAKEEKILAPFTDVVPNTALGAYWLQLSFYGSILATHGRVIKGLRVHHWTGGPDGWVTYEHPMLDLTAAFQES